MRRIGRHCPATVAVAASLSAPSPAVTATSLTTAAISSAMCFPSSSFRSYSNSDVVLSPSNPSSSGGGRGNGGSGRGGGSGRLTAKQQAAQAKRSSSTPITATPPLSTVAPSSSAAKLVSGTTNNRKGNDADEDGEDDDTFGEEKAQQKPSLAKTSVRTGRDDGEKVAIGKNDALTSNPSSSPSTLATIATESQSPPTTTATSPQQAPPPTNEQLHKITLQHREALAALARRTSNLQQKMTHLESLTLSKQGYLHALRTQMEKLVVDRRTTRILMRQCLLEIQFLSARTMVLGTHVAKMDKDLTRALCFDNPSLSEMMDEQNKNNKDKDTPITPAEMQAMIEERFKQKVMALMPLVTRSNGGNHNGNGNTDGGVFGNNQRQSQGVGSQGVFSNVVFGSRIRSSRQMRNSSTGGRSAVASSASDHHARRAREEDMYEPVGNSSFHCGMGIVTGGTMSDLKYKSPSQLENSNTDDNNENDNGITINTAEKGAVEEFGVSPSSRGADLTEAVIPPEKLFSQAELEAFPVLKLTTVRLDGNENQNNNVGDVRGDSSPSSSAALSSSTSSTRPSRPIHPAVISNEVQRVAFQNTAELLNAIERHKMSLRQAERRLVEGFTKGSMMTASSSSSSLSLSSESNRSGSGSGSGRYSHLYPGRGKSKYGHHSDGQRDFALERLQRLVGEVGNNNDNNKKSASSSSASSSLASSHSSETQPLPEMPFSNPSPTIAEKLRILGDLYRQLQHEDARLLKGIRRRLGRATRWAMKERRTIVNLRQEVNEVDVDASASPIQAESKTSPPSTKTAATAASPFSKNDTPEQVAIHQQQTRESRKVAALAKRFYEKQYMSLLDKRQRMLAALEDVLRSHLLEQQHGEGEGREGSSHPENNDAVGENSTHNHNTDSLVTSTSASEAPFSPAASLSRSSPQHIVLPAGALTDAEIKAILERFRNCGEKDADGTIKNNRDDKADKNTAASPAAKPFAMNADEVVTEKFHERSFRMREALTAAGGGANPNNGAAAPSNGSNGSKVRPPPSLIQDLEFTRALERQQSHKAAESFQTYLGTDQRVLDVIAPAIIGGKLASLSVEAAEKGEATSLETGKAQSSSSSSSKVSADNLLETVLNEKEGKRLGPAYLQRLLKAEAAAEIAEETKTNKNRVSEEAEEDDDFDEDPEQQSPPPSSSPSKAKKGDNGDDDDDDEDI